jgi:hypothetical protein
MVPRLWNTTWNAIRTCSRPDDLIFDKELSFSLKDNAILLCHHLLLLRISLLYGV